MGKWLAAYRAGLWREGFTGTWEGLGTGAWVVWRSHWGGCRGGRLLMASPDGWVVVGTKNGLTWVREERVVK